MSSETIESEFKYRGKIIDLRVDTVREGDIEYKREIVVHRGRALTMPVFDGGMVEFVGQYRHAAGKYLLEVPASNSTSSRAHGE